MLRFPYLQTSQLRMSALAIFASPREATHSCLVLSRHSHLVLIRLRYTIRIECSTPIRGVRAPISSSRNDLKRHAPSHGGPGISGGSATMGGGPPRPVSCPKRTFAAWTAWLHASSSAWIAVLLLPASNGFDDRTTTDHCGGAEAGEASTTEPQAASKPRAPPSKLILNQSAKVAPRSASEFASRRTW